MATCTVVQGWRQAAARAGLAPTTLRRLADRGGLPHRRAGAVVEFDAAVLDELRAARGGTVPVPTMAWDVGDLGVDVAEDAGRLEVAAKVHAATAVASEDPVVLDKLVAAARERAETERLRAEIGRLRAEHELSELQAGQQQRARADRIESLVAGAVAHLDPRDRHRLAQAARVQLNRLESLGPLAVGRALALAQEQVLAAGAPVARGAPRTAANEPSIDAQAQRMGRLAGVLQALGDELAHLGYSADDVSGILNHVGHGLSFAEDRILFDDLLVAAAARSLAKSVMA